MVQRERAESTWSSARASERAEGSAIGNVPDLSKLVRIKQVVMSAPAYIGDPCLFEEQDVERMADVDARTDIDSLEMHRDDFRELVTQDPKLLDLVQEFIADRGQGVVGGQKCERCGRTG